MSLKKRISISMEGSGTPPVVLKEELEHLCDVEPRIIAALPKLRYAAHRPPKQPVTPWTPGPNPAA
jgi:hypothetical protein